MVLFPGTQAFTWIAHPGVTGDEQALRVRSPALLPTDRYVPGFVKVPHNEVTYWPGGTVVVHDEKTLLVLAQYPEAEQVPLHAVE